MTKEQLEKKVQLSNELLELLAKYELSLENDEILEVRKKIRLQIKKIEQELQALKTLQESENA